MQATSAWPSASSQCHSWTDCSKLIDCEADGCDWLGRRVCSAGSLLASSSSSSRLLSLALTDCSCCSSSSARSLRCRSVMSSIVRRTAASIALRVAWLTASFAGATLAPWLWATPCVTARAAASAAWAASWSAAWAAARAAACAVASSAAWAAARAAACSAARVASRAADERHSIITFSDSGPFLTPRRQLLCLVVERERREKR
jgi:hypothetical protein